MEKNSYKGIVVLSLCVAIISLSVAFIVLSQSLIMNKNLISKDSKWSIYFSDLSMPEIIGNASIITPASFTLGSTTLSLKAKLSTPGDSITYNFSVKNVGSMDAVISSIKLTGVDNVSTKDIIYSLTYTNGTVVNANDILSAGETKILKLTITSKSILDSGEFDLGALITYIQYN